jgi:geranylgeranyl reductase family protein
MTPTFDVAVIGAGPAGAATAAFLAHRGIQVLLLDKAQFPRDKTCGDAISPRAIHFLHTLGIEHDLQEAAFQIQSVAVTSPRGHQVTIPISRHPDYPSYAYVLPRLKLDQLILARAISAGAEFRPGVQVRDILLDDHDGLEMRCDGRGTRFKMRARLAVIATGAHIPLLRQLGLLPRRMHFSYAARAYFAGVQDLGEAIHIHFDGIPLPGYGWLFPLAGGGANIGVGFYRRSRRTPPTAREAAELFLNHNSIRRYLRSAQQTSPIKGFPIRMDFHRSPIVGRRILLVGETAGLVNPFTGEGIDYALETAHIAVEQIHAAFQDGIDPHKAIQNYERAMRARFQHNFKATHLLRTIYLNPLLLDPLVLACQRWPEVGKMLVDIMLEYRDPFEALRPDIALRVLRCISPR